MHRRARSVPGSPRLVDYQFLGMVAVVLAVVTRGAVLPVLVMTAIIALLTLAHEAGARRYRRYAGSTDSAATDSAPRTEAELTAWVKTVERLLRSRD